MKNRLYPNNSQIEIINGLSTIQFKNFCSSFFSSIGLINIQSVEVLETGMIKGKGTIELGTFMSYHFAFLGKQHIGEVPDTIIKQSHNTMENQTNKGFILTTGTFSREAKKQAKMKGQIPIDLIDGNNLTERLKRMQLNISFETGELLKKENSDKF